MKTASFLFLLLVFQGCATTNMELDRLNANLKGNKIAELKFEDDWAYSPIICDKPALQRLLLNWSDTLHAVPTIYSTQPRAEVIRLSFENGNEFILGVYRGNVQLKYSISYMKDGSYAGELLDLGKVCSYEHDKSAPPKLLNLPIQ